ncbi:MAG: hypothetical protein QXP31_01085 [Pyrobaculum sp.]
MLRLGFYGRRSVYEVVKRVAFNVGLFEKGDVVVVDAKMRERGDVVLTCEDYLCVARELFIALPKLLGGGRLGVDLGASKNGLAYVWNGEPVLHAVVSWPAVEEVLREAASVRVHMGSSPYVDVKRAASLLRCREVRLVDELAASWSRAWLKRRYPWLGEDELDALSFTYHEGVAATIC